MKQPTYFLVFFRSIISRSYRNIYTILISFFLAALPYNNLSAQTATTQTGAVTDTVFDEIPITVSIEAYGSISLNILYTSNNLLYINIEELFSKLLLNYEASASGDSINGLAENGSKPYLIDYKKKEIKSGNSTLAANNGLIKEMGIIYMESSLLAETFGITMTFNFRSLSCGLTSNFELPLMKELRLKKMRSNLSNISGEIMADTVLGRNYHLFKFGMADWSVTTGQIWNKQSLNRFSLGIGAELFYGEAAVSYNHTNQYKFDGRQLDYIWRWIDNDKKYIKQAEIGKISPRLISYINAPIVGATIRNARSTVRKATGFFVVNEITEPNWTVELYINNALVDFTKADAAGQYYFKVPIVYGYSTLKLKFYGPLGEERTEERTFNTAYTLMPKKELEYGLSAGFLQDSINTRMGRAEFNYGVTHVLTVGGGLEYLSSLPGSPYIPFTNFTYQPFSKLVLNFDYAHGMKTRALLNYYLNKMAFLELSYINYKNPQLATVFNASQELNARFSMPLKYKKLGALAAVEYSKRLYRGSSYDQLYLIFSGYYKQYSFNSTTQLNWAPENKQYTSTGRSTLALTYRAKNGLNIRPTIIYNLDNFNLMIYGAELDKRIKNGYLSISFQKNIMLNTYTTGLTLRYDLKFVRTNLATQVSNENISTSQNAQGSIAFGSAGKYIHPSMQPALGKGGISIYPFLDLNQNGKFDKGEHLVKLSSLKVMSSNVIFGKDSIIRIPGLYALNSYTIEFNDRDLENISWRFKDHIYNILIDPNQFKRVEVPIIAMGEVNGMVYMNTNNSLKGIGRIIIGIYEKDSTNLIAETLSESDGYIQYLGLKPGEYTARLDTAQLNKLGLSASTLEIDFMIKSTEQGDIAGPVNFTLKKEELIEIPIKK